MPPAAWWRLRSRSARRTGEVLGHIGGHAPARARLRREDAIDIREESATLELLDVLSGSWLEILPVERVRSGARRLLRVHALRAADALQLAAALEWRQDNPNAELVTFDERLASAARLEGFCTPL